MKEKIIFIYRTINVSSSKWLPWSRYQKINPGPGIRLRINPGPLLDPRRKYEKKSESILYLHFLLRWCIKFSVNRKYRGVALEGEDHGGNGVGGCEGQRNPLDFTRLFRNLTVKFVDSRRQNALRCWNVENIVTFIFPTILLFKIFFLNFR